MNRQSADSKETYQVKDAEENVVMEVSPKNAFSMLVVASENMTAENTYSLWLDDTKVADGMPGGMMGPGMDGGMRPQGEMPEGMMPPGGFGDGEFPEGMPEGMMPPEGFGDGEFPEGFPDGMPEGMMPPEGFNGGERPERPRN